MQLKGALEYRYHSCSTRLLQNPLLFPTYCFKSKSCAAGNSSRSHMLNSSWLSHGFFSSSKSNCQARLASFQILIATSKGSTMLTPMFQRDRKNFLQNFKNQRIFYDNYQPSQSCHLKFVKIYINI